MEQLVCHRKSAQQANIVTCHLQIHHSLPLMWNNLNTEYSQPLPPHSPFTDCQPWPILQSRPFEFPEASCVQGIYISKYSMTAWKQGQCQALCRLFILTFPTALPYRTNVNLPICVLCPGASFALLFMHFGAITKQNKHYLENKHCDTMTVSLISKIATKWLTGA
jgi:hypothetical protein